MKIIHYNPSNGRILGFYDENVHQANDIPGPNITVNNDVWEDILENEHNRKVDTSTKELIADAAPRPSITITNNHVNKERTRRIESDLTISLSTGKTFTIKTRPEDRENMMGMSMAALSNAISEFIYRDAINTDHTLNQTEIIELGLQTLQWVKSHYEASWVLKAMDPIPEDFRDDSYWP